MGGIFHCRHCGTTISYSGPADFERRVDSHMAEKHNMQKVRPSRRQMTL